MAKPKSKPDSALAVIENDPALAKYLDAAEENAGGQSWIPKKVRDWIGGTVEAMKSVKGKWGEQILLILKTKGGVVSHYCNSVLMSQFDKVGVKVGDKIVVVYLGPRPSKKGRPYKLYGVQKVK
jgi:hypothetical protein